MDVVGAPMKHFDLGRIGNTTAGAIGGLSGG
jgi:hypothetical protein